MIPQWIIITVDDDNHRLIYFTGSYAACIRALYNLDVRARANIKAIEIKRIEEGNT